MKHFILIFCFSAFVFSQETTYVKRVEIQGETNLNEPLPLPVVDNPPVFKGCPSKTAQEKRNCLMLSLKAMFDNKFKYPKKSEKINHRFFVSFIVDKTGSITLENILRCQDKLVEEEFRKIYKKIPNAVPATDKNKAVSVKLLLPIDIKWEGK